MDELIDKWDEFIELWFEEYGWAGRKPEYYDFMMYLSKKHNPTSKQ